MPVGRGGYQDAETGLTYAGGSSYYLAGRGGFLTPYGQGFMGGNPYAYLPGGDDDPDAGILPHDWDGYNFTQDTFRSSVHQGAGIAEEALVTASEFNPIFLAGEVISGQNAAGHRISKAQRALALLALVSGPAGKAAGKLGTEAAGFAKAKVIEPLVAKGVAAVTQNEWHHLFPAAGEFAEQWARLRIDIHDFASLLPKDFHQNWIHGVPPDGIGGWWNKEWRVFFKNNRLATPAQVFAKLQEMREFWGIDNVAIGRYPWAFFWK